jgi:hypothetical protein
MAKIVNNLEFIFFFSGFTAATSVANRLDMSRPIDSRR